MTTYRIIVKSLSPHISKPLQYTNVKSYDTSYAGLITFIDSKTGKTKRFAIANVEIEEECEQ